MFFRILQCSIRLFATVLIQKVLHYEYGRLLPHYADGMGQGFVVNLPFPPVLRVVISDGD